MENLHLGDKACALNVSEACLSLGIQYFENKQFKETEQYYKKACNLNLGKGCAFLAAFVLNQKVNYKEFEKYAFKGCKLKDPTSCLMLSNSKKMGVFEKPNIVESLMYLKEACKYDSEKLYFEECRDLEGLN